MGAEVLTEAVSFVGLTNTRWGFQPPGGNDFAPHKDTSNKIQNNDSRIQNVVYRNGSLWTAHNAFLPVGAVTRTAVQWWEIDTSPSITVLQFGRIDDSTGVMFYAFPSIGGTGLTGAELAERLLVEADVCVLAGTAFGGVGTDHIRISYANSRENLTEALGRIDRFVAGLGRA